MSFRRRSAALTDEDLEIWWAKVHRGDDAYTIGTLGIHSIESDRRDADLMLALTRARNGLRNLKKTAQTIYDGLTPHEQDVMRRLWGTRRPE